MKKSVLYSITNPVNNKKYIGISSEFDNRKRNHLWHLRNNKHGNEKLQNAFNKYGEENFCFDIILCFLSNDRLELLKIENNFIEKYDTYKNGYNKSIGFDGSILLKPSEKWRKSTSERMKGNTYWLGRKQSEEHIYKRTRVHKGKTLSKETKSKISDSRKGKFTGEDNPFYGKSHTEEFKNEIAKKLGKKIRCVETGEVFNSVSECAKQMNADRRNVQRVCTGKYKSTKGYSFEFIET